MRAEVLMLAAVGALAVAVAGVASAMGRAPAAAAPALFEDVDPALLHGATLTLPEANFSVTAPASTGWSWKTLAKGAAVLGQAPQGRFFFCVPAGGGAMLMLIVSSPSGTDHLDARVMEGMKKGAMETAANGIRATAFSYEPTSVPLPGSYRVRMEVAGQDGAAGRCFGTVVWTRRVVTMQACTAAAREPPELTAFVKSFRTLVPPPAPSSWPNDQAIGRLMSAVLIALFLAYVGRAARRRNAGRRGPDVPPAPGRPSD